MENYKDLQSGPILPPVTPISIRVPRETLASLDLEAEAFDMTRSAYVNLALNHFLSLRLASTHGDSWKVVSPNGAVATTLFAPCPYGAILSGVQSDPLA